MTAGANIVRISQAWGRPGVDFIEKDYGFSRLARAILGNRD